MRTEAEDLLGHFEPRTVLKVFTVSSSLREPVLVSVNLWKRHLRYCNRTEAVIDQKKRPAETSLHYVKRPIRTKTSRFEANGERKKRRDGRFQMSRRVAAGRADRFDGGDRPVRVGRAIRFRPEQ